MNNFKITNYNAFNIPNEADIYVNEYLFKWTMAKSADDKDRLKVYKNNLYIGDASWQDDEIHPAANPLEAAITAAEALAEAEVA